MNYKDIILLDEKNKLITLLYKNKKINIDIIYRKRKNISIKIIPKDKIEIISPKSVSITYLRDLVFNKIEWIIKNLDKFENIDDIYENRNYIDGEKFYYLGEIYTLKVIKDKNINNIKKDYCYIKIHDKYLVINSNRDDKEFLKDNIKKWYKKESEKIILERIEYLKRSNDIMNKLQPQIIKVKEQKKIWGSCTSSKSIYINSRISMVRLDAIDYIIIHEFCHLVHMNHSKDFYNLVKCIMPNYKVANNWLRENGYKLIL